jgi:hypothetical protein
MPRPRKPPRGSATFKGDNKVALMLGGIEAKP